MNQSVYRVRVYLLTGKKNVVILIKISLWDGPTNDVYLLTGKKNVVGWPTK